MKINALIEKNNNNFYAISSDTPIGGCYFAGYGYSVKEAKEDYYKSIEEMRAIKEECGEDVSDLDGLHINFKYDTMSFFNAFQWLKIGEFAKEAGINESKMRAYKAGLATPSEKTMEKMRAALKKITAELSACSL